MSVVMFEDGATRIQQVDGTFAEIGPGAFARQHYDNVSKRFATIQRVGNSSIPYIPAVKIYSNYGEQYDQIKSTGGTYIPYKPIDITCKYCGNKHYDSKNQCTTCGANKG
jgi:hypothetical protein